MIVIDVNIIDMINSRLDVSFYRSRFHFTSQSYPTLNLSELLWVNPTVKYDNLSDKDFISFVPMEVVDEKDGKIAEQRTTTISKTKGFTKFKENDLIWAKITPCMQNGKSAIARNLVNGYGCGSTEFYVLRPKTDNVLIEYIHFILRDKRVLESAKNSFGGSAGQQRVSSGYLKSIQIPLPPKEIQQQIVNLYNRAVEEKQAKEQEAQALLAGIDDYLLKELGIELPENVGNERYFEVNIWDLIGGRLDVFYYRKEFRDLFEIIKNKSEKKLRNYLTSINYGASVSNEYVENGIPFLRIKDLLPNEIQKSEIVYLPYEMKKKLQTSFVKKDDFLISRSGTIGVAAIVTDEFDEFAFGSFMIRFSTQNINRQFLSYYINSTIGQYYFLRNRIGAIQSNITIPTIKDLPIPDITIVKQNEIAEHIQFIRARAKRLQEEGREGLERAKGEIEKRIIGV